MAVRPGRPPLATAGGIGLARRMARAIGVIAALFRYPVKSMAGESLDSADLGWHGLDGDRRLAFRRLEDRRPSSRADRRIDRAAEADLKRFASSVHYWAADAFARLGDPTRAAMAWRRAFEIDPEDGESREALALLLENAGRTRESMRVMPCAPC